jgi:AraC-like DNA-binding protein
VGRQRKLTDADIALVVERYSKGEKTKALALEFSISQRTLQRIIRITGTSRKRGRCKDEHYAAFIRYTKGHPDDVLPRNMAEIAKRVGCTPEAVKAYLYRMRRELRRKAEGCDFRHPSFKYKDIHGRTIPARAIESYVVQVESWTNVVRLNVTLKGGAGKTTIRLPAKLVTLLSSKASAVHP